MNRKELDETGWFALWITTHLLTQVLLTIVVGAVVWVGMEDPANLHITRTRIAVVVALACVSAFSSLHLGYMIGHFVGRNTKKT